MDEFAPESHAILAIAWPDGGFSATFASGGLSGKASGSPASASGRVRTRVRRRRPAASGDFWRRPAASGSLSQVLSRRPAASGARPAASGEASGGVRRPSGTAPAASGARPGHVRAASGPPRPQDAGRQVPRGPGRPRPTPVLQGEVYAPGTFLHFLKIVNTVDHSVRTARSFTPARHISSLQTLPHASPTPTRHSAKRASPLSAK